MAESALQITYTTIREEVADYLGYTRNYDSLSNQQKADVDRAIASGQRWAFSPPGDLVPEGFVWDWLQLTAGGVGIDGDKLVQGSANGVTPSGAVYDLPDDFATIIGDITLTDVANNPDGDVITRVQTISPERLTAMLARDAQTTVYGRPKYAATRIKDTGGTDGQRYEILFYPEPAPESVVDLGDQAQYSVQYRYKVTPAALTGVDDRPPGTAEHAELVLYACLAAAERHKDDEEGVRWKMFAERVKASVSVSAQAQTPTADDHYPIQAPSATLEITYADLKREVGQVRGFGLEEKAWSHVQLRDVQYCIVMGLRTFYAAHPWKFLNINFSVTLDSQASNPNNTGDPSVVQLPADFAGDLEDFNFTTAAGQRIPTIPVERMSALHANHPRDATTGDKIPGQPRYVSVESDKKIVATINQEGPPIVWNDPVTLEQIAWYARFYPQPDRISLGGDPEMFQEYVLDFEGTFLPPLLSDDADVPYGQQYHSQTILAACCMCAEMKTGGAGQWAQTYATLLEQSRAFDGRVAKEDQATNWPIDGMSDSQQLTWFDFMNQVGGHLGYGYDIKAFTHNQLEECRFIVRRAYQRFLYPTNDENQIAHEWSFLSPVRTINVFPKIVPVYKEENGTRIQTTSVEGPNKLITLEDAVVAGDWANQYAIVNDAAAEPGKILEVRSSTQFLLEGSPAGFLNFKTVGVQANPASWDNTTKLLTAFLPGAFSDSMEGMTIEVGDLNGGKEAVITAVNSDVELLISGLDLSSYYRTWEISQFAFNYRLPAEVNGIDGSLTFESESAGYFDVQLTDESHIRSARQRMTITNGFPRKAAILPLRSDATAQQRRDLMIYPNVDAPYTLQYRYPIVAENLSETSPVPYGGPAQSENILASCLAMAQEHKDGAPGPLRDAYDRRLKAAIASDARGYDAEHLGYNRDNSDIVYSENPYRSNRNWWRNNVVTYEGQVYF